MSSTPMRFLPVNHHALLVELPDLACTLDLLAALQDEPPAGVNDLVPAAHTILVCFDPRQTHASALRRAIEGLPLQA